MSWSPINYEQATVLQRTVGHELVSRLALMTVTPQRILDVNGGLAELGMSLQARYPAAQIIVQNAEWEALVYARQDYPKLHYLCNAMSSLSFAPCSFDLLCANLVLPWCQALTPLLQDWRAVLSPSGLILFSALGLDTLLEIKEVLSRGMIPTLWDMHDLGDAFVQFGFVDPVVEVEHFAINYRDKKQCVNELVASQMIHQADAADLLKYLYESSIQDNTSMTYEVIYGHAWLPTEKGYRANQEGVVQIPLSALRASKNKDK